jgi:hypothetical protein
MKMVADAGSTVNFCRPEYALSCFGLADMGHGRRDPEDPGYLGLKAVSAHVT